jgi:hypothetical protein
MSQFRKALKPLKFRLSSVTDEEARKVIQEKYYELQFKREQAVSAQRAALVADRQQKILQAESEISVINLLTYTGDYIDKVKTEPVWLTYMENGELTFECPFSENDMINNLKLQRAGINKAAEEFSKEDKTLDFYDDSSEDSTEK